tara:strand:- start:565 stop:1647 length:1083 start_codon:yes stop_codon:yes gene_type:complete
MPKNMFKRKNIFYRLGQTAAVIFGLSKGVVKYTSDSASDINALILSDKKIKKLQDKMLQQNIEYKKIILEKKSKYPYMDSAIIAGLTLPQMLKNGVSEDIQLAYELSFPEKAKAISFTDAWSDFDNHNQRLGFINTVKGKLFEIKYVDHLNATLEPGYSAAIAKNVNQPGWDIAITGPDEKIIEQIQLKATTSVAYIKEHLKRYPDIDVVTLEDLKGQIGLSEKVTYATASNSDLQAEIIGSTSEAYSYLPISIVLTYVIFSSYKRDDLSNFEKNIEIGRRGTGLALSGAILMSTGLFGIFGIFLKDFALNKGNKKRQYIASLREQIHLQRNTIKFWKKNVSRRDFLKGLALTAAIPRIK